jgi:DNA-binding SARP family transcriptional activator
VLELKLFGIAKAVYNSQTIKVPPKLLALLCYLALQKTGITRSILADMFWGKDNTHDLRMALNTLKALPGGKSWLIAPHNSEQVSLIAKTDVERFVEYLEKGKFDKALELNPKGEQLFSGSKARNLSAAFIDWLELEQLRVHEQYLEVVKNQIEVLKAKKDYSGAKKIVRNAMLSDPFGESLQYMLIELEYLENDLEAALIQFEHYRKRLKETFGETAEPTEKIKVLLGRLEAGNVSSQRKVVLLDSVEAIPELPEQLIGRKALLQKLFEELKVAKRVLLHGFGGVGKTAIAASFVKPLVSSGKKVLWLRLGADEIEVLYESIAMVLGEQKTFNQETDKKKAIKNLIIKHGIEFVVLDDVWNSFSLTQLLETGLGPDY